MHNGGSFHSFARRFTRPGIWCHRGWKILEPAMELPGTQWRSTGVSKPFQARMQTADE